MQIKKQPLRIYSWQEQLCAFLLVAIVAAGFFYVYFMSISVVHVVQREQLDTESLRLHSYVSELEAEYITLGKVVTREKADALGMVEPTHLSYAERRSLALQVLEP